MAFLGRYDRYGWDYARMNPSDERALRWYRRHARETGGPILEVACGTGRLLAALARDGHEVVGLDLSETMLDLARRRIARLPPEVASRVTLVRADMRQFQVGRDVALAIVADNSLREVETRGGMLACLSSIRHHLRPEGRLLVTERRFDPERFPGGGAEWPWSDPVQDPRSQATIRRKVRVRLDEGARRLRGVMTYRATSPDGTTRTEEFVFESPVLCPRDHADLLAEAGFTSRLFVGYEEKDDDGRDPMLCFVARHSSGDESGSRGLSPEAGVRPSV